MEPLAALQAKALAKNSKLTSLPLHFLKAVWQVSSLVVWLLLDWLSRPLLLCGPEQPKLERTAALAMVVVVVAHLPRSDQQMPLTQTRRTRLDRQLRLPIQGCREHRFRLVVGLRKPTLGSWTCSIWQHQRR